MTIILDGKKTAQKIISKISEEVFKLDVKPKLGVILAGDNPASLIYVNNKLKIAKEIGIEVDFKHFTQNLTNNEIIKKILEWNKDDSVNAILVQLPLPGILYAPSIIEKIDSKKDADGFTPYNIGQLILGYKPYAEPCTPKGIIRLLKEYNIEIEGKIAVVLGRSNIVGKPLSALLRQNNAAVINLHSKTSEKNILAFSKQADILVAAIGQPNYVTSEFVKDDAVVIDVGINRVNNKIIGDVDFKSVVDKASYITPVPGGVGPMTIAMLMENTLELYKNQHKKINPL